MTLPGVSMLCPTYGRAPFHLHLLAQTVECYRRCAARYPGPCELVILDDTPEQTLLCDVPGVRIVHAPERHATLGEKRNALVEMAAYDILLPTDDDDVSLPWRVEQAAAVLVAKEASYWNPRHYWYWTPGFGERLRVPGSLGYGHNCSAYTRAAWAAAGGYPAVSGSEDAAMDGRLRRCPGVRTVDGLGRLAPADWPYVYCWGVSPRHLSGRADLERHYQEIGRGRVVPGTYRIEPRWERDWATMTRTALLVSPG